MRFLIDAHLPRRLAYLLNEAGHDAKHTLDLPSANRTSDPEIIRIADSEKRVVVTKDADFVTSFLVHDQPQQLLLISTGNIRNAELLTLIVTHLTTIEASFTIHRFVELTHNSLIIHS